jgi:D-alanyl-D-alanine carboxypeptidase
LCDAQQQAAGGCPAVRHSPVDPAAGCDPVDPAREEAQQFVGWLLASRCATPENKPGSGTVTRRFVGSLPCTTGYVFDTSSTFFYADRDEYGAVAARFIDGGELAVRVVMSKERGWARALKPRARLLGRMALCVIAATGLLGSLPATAQNAPVFEWILLDAETGQVLSEQNADVTTPPASLTKMMTLYLTFEQLNQGTIRLDQQFYVSAEAASRAPSKLALTPGDSVPVRDLILGVVTKSANDAASVVAEGLAGSEANFVQYMNSKARQLGMQQTWYRNASGLPDPAQRTTARDVARLALALYHQFPREYRYFATREFDFRGEIVKSHNHLLDWYQGADGIKTGYVNASGFNLAASAVRDGRRLIGVIMGGRSWHSRDQQMASLLDQGFAVLAAGRPVQPASTALVAAAAPPAAAPAPPPAAPAPPAAAVMAAAPAPPAAVAAPPAAPAETAAAQQKSGFLGKVAKAALQHLSPVGKAEAAPLAHEANGTDWAIQIGAYHDEAAAEEATRSVAGLAIAKSKPHQILAPAKHESSRLYRARILHFTAKGAQAACAELHHKGIACSVVHPGSLKVASR